MRIPRLYFPKNLTVHTHITLTDAAFHHAVRVLRLRSGAPVILFNGTGGEFHGILDDVAHHNATVHIQHFIAQEKESPLKILLAQGISRGDRMDYTLQKAVELGVTAILPLFTERGVIDLKDKRLAKRMQHWQKIIIGACEQSGRNQLPPVLEPMALATWLTNNCPGGLKLVLDPRADQRLRTITPATQEMTLLIGPEGGLTQNELQLAEAKDFMGVQLGPRILRTETAAVAALSALQVRWGDLG
jgi:16S rRNA (uracil1498-N3)-methyltransferase